MKKKPNPPGSIEDREHIEQLVVAARLPHVADMPRMVTAIQHALRTYLAATAVPDDNLLHHEIRALYFAAWRRRYAEAARRIDELSPPARDYINKRVARRVPWTLPDSAGLRDKATQDEVRETILNLLARGGVYQPGRIRGGKRPMRWVPILCAPALQRHPPKRQAEHALVLALTLIYFNATGEIAFTANHRAPGPLARLTKACLDLVGAKFVDAVATIKTAHQHRQEMRDLLELWATRRDLMWELLEFDLEQRHLGDGEHPKKSS